MKKVFIILTLAATMVAFSSCKSQEQKVLDKANELAALIDEDPYESIEEVYEDAGTQDLDQILKDIDEALDAMNALQELAKFAE